MLTQQAIAPSPTARSSVTGAGARATAGGLNNVFLIEFERFDLDEVLPLQAIVKDFPKSRDISLSQGGAGAFSFNLTTTAPAEDVLRYLALMINDRGYRKGTINISSSPGKFLIQRVINDGYRPGAPHQP